MFSTRGTCPCGLPHLTPLNDAAPKVTPLAAWGHYSSRHSDPESFQPHDEDAYGLRQQQRDADTLSAFGRVYHHADELVHVAEQQLARLAPSDRTRRYAWQVR
ncbi:hypothetical protein [Streptomyces montanus]|uniref:hypothetical protein n=1 Tax=Streptomyces montanus TaxID=2580423 RepID=UPI001FEA27F3|nr:hypothetical protein [Streptomyces montanus]